MEIDDIRAFVAVADTGSVSRAAGALLLTQPAVTRRLQRLESELGVALLDRRRRPIELTVPGQAALERCRNLLASIQELCSAAGTGTGHEPGGELRIGVEHALTELTLAEPLDQVQGHFPRVALRLSTGWSRDLVERVRTQIIDAAFVMLPRGEPLPAGVDGERVAEERLVVVAPRSQRSADVRELADLAGHGWVLNPEGCTGGAALQRTLLQAHHATRVAVETYNYELQLSLVARKRGFGLVPSRLLARSRFRRQVRALHVRGIDFRLTIWSLRRRPPVGLHRVLDELTHAVASRLLSSPARGRPIARRRRRLASG